MKEETKKMWKEIGDEICLNLRRIDRKISEWPYKFVCLYGVVILMLITPTCSTNTVTVVENPALGRPAKIQKPKPIEKPKLIPPMSAPKFKPAEPQSVDVPVQTNSFVLNKMGEALAKRKPLPPLLTTGTPDGWYISTNGEQFRVNYTKDNGDTWHYTHYMDTYKETTGQLIKWYNLKQKDNSMVWVKVQ